MYLLAPECGARIIIVKSTTHKLQKLATIVAAKDDVALLKLDGDFPPDVCVLGLRAQDIFDIKAIRFGIPGGFPEPGPAAAVKIGPQRSSFSPLILLAPIVAEKGESGGPVIYQFNVVGITRARHEVYPTYSFMMAGATIRALLNDNAIRPSGHICNPVESDMWNSIGGGGPSHTLSPGGCSVDPKTGSVFCGAPDSGLGSYYASVKLKGRLAAENTVVMADVFGTLGKSNDQSFAVGPSKYNFDYSESNDQSFTARLNKYNFDYGKWIDQSFAVGRNKYKFDYGKWTDQSFTAGPDKYNFDYGNWIDQSFAVDPNKYNFDYGKSNDQSLAIGPYKHNFESRRSSDQPVTVSPFSYDFSNSGVSIEGRVFATDKQGEVADKVALVSGIISEQVKAALWKRYVLEGEKAGKWKETGADLPPSLVCGSPSKC